MNTTQQPPEVQEVPANQNSMLIDVQFPDLQLDPEKDKKISDFVQKFYKRNRKLMSRLANE